jgi:Domain of unknown function (DUF4160)
MPEISRFFGIIIAMYHGDHPPSHFHVRYAEHRAKIDIESGALIAGQLPRRVLALVREWRELHLDELKHDWELVEQRQPPNKIEPLE